MMWLLFGIVFIGLIFKLVLDQFEINDLRKDVDNLYKQITRLDDLIVEQMAKIHRLEVRK